MMNGLTYKEIIKHSKRGNENTMWDAIDRVNDLVERLRKAHPDMAHEFLLKEYVAMNGRHFNEWLAKETVSQMWHKDENGDMVTGEVVDQQDAMRLLDGMDDEKREKMRWDSYVAANAMVHDTAAADIPKSEALKIAKVWWFHDDDMEDGCHKVFWYFFK